MTSRTKIAIATAEAKGRAAAIVERTHPGAYRNPYGHAYLRAAWERGFAA